MNKDETAKCIEIMQAYLNGVEVECRRKQDADNWLQFKEFFWDFWLYDYRIKQDLIDEYEPYNCIGDIELQAIFVYVEEESQWRVCGYTVHPDNSLNMIVLDSLANPGEGRSATAKMILDGWRDIADDSKPLGRLINA